MNTLPLKKVFFKPFMREWSWPKCDENPSEWRKVSFRSEAGIKLTGLYSKSGMDSKGLIVCGHPMHPLAKGYFLRYGHATMLKKAGYDVFLFDFNGFGESKNGSFDFSRDVLAAVDKASDMTNKKIGYLGISFGASWCISAMQYPHKIWAAFLECPFTSLEEFWINYPLAYVVLKAMRTVNPSLYNKLHPIVNAVEAKQVKYIRLVYGQKDTTTPPEMGRRFMNTFNTEQNYRCESVNWFNLPTIEMDMKVLPDTGHAKGNLNENYFEYLVNFFNKSIADENHSAYSKRSKRGRYTANKKHYEI